MLQWVSRLSKQLVHHGPREPSVLAPDETPRDEVEVIAKGPDGTLGDVKVVLTKKRLLLTNPGHTKETLSIPLVNVMALESTPGGILTDRVFISRTRPSPWQTRQGFEMMVPAPRHRGQVC